MLLQKASLGTSDPNVIGSRGKESRARGVPSATVCLLSLPVGTGQQDAPRFHESTASFFQVDKLAFCQHGISQTGCCLSAAPGARPQNKPCFITVRRRKKIKEIQERKVMCSEQHIHPSQTLRRQVNKSKDKTVLLLPTNQTPDGCTSLHISMGLFCKPFSQCFFSLLNRQQQFASLCVKA